MILKEEIQAIATEKRLGIDMIEKDYILGWVLSGIHHHKLTKNSWVFKGGTCLKKCYFETFRFSEDLDFTYRGEPQETTGIFYKNIFTEIAQWIYNQSGVELPEEGIEFEVFKNKRNSSSVQGKLTYRGPIKRNVSITRLPRLKIDLTLDEPLLLEPQIKIVNHSYSDASQAHKKILAYSLEEIFAEKLRALTQRLRPRDLYDVVHLYQKMGADADLNILSKTLEKKCELRSTPFPQIEFIETHGNRQLLESEWSTQLRHQMPELPPFAPFMNQLKNVLDWVASPV